MTFDMIIRGGRYFDGAGGASSVRNIGINDGHIVAVSRGELDETGCPEVIDATNKWVMPGFIDVHTHYDVEVLDGPGLPESLRHGVTTVVMGSCSLSTIHVDHVTAADLFARVEAIPYQCVVSAVERHKTWTNPEEYVRAIESLALGPNVTAFFGHSDMRASIMGLDRATRADVRATRAEVARMETMLDDALDAGFIGMSTMELKFDKLDGEQCRSRTLPSTYASARENRKLLRILRRRGRVVQNAPNIKNPLSLLIHMLRSIGFGSRKPLRTSLLAAADAKSNSFGIYVLGPPARAVNKLGADFRWQHLPVPFTVYANGIDLVVFEEFGSGAAALHLRTELERDELMREEAYRRAFRKDYDNKFGIKAWHRDFFDAEITECPDQTIIGKTFGQVGVERGGVHPVDAFLDLVLEHGKSLRWRTTISNHRPDTLKKMAVDPALQMGFSDAGAHLRNMAFYNSSLRLLQHVREAQKAGRPFMTVERAVHRLTGELADWYRLDAGHIRIGDRADLVVVNPEALDDRLDAYVEAPVEEYGGMARMVNRSEGTVVAVLVSGRKVIDNGVPTAILGTERTGSFLRADRPCPAVPAEKGQLTDVR